jgi:hypothetical protein
MEVRTRDGLGASDAGMRIEHITSKGSRVDDCVIEREREREREGAQDFRFNYY